MYTMYTLRYKVGSPLRTDLEKHKPQCMKSLHGAFQKAVSSSQRKSSAVKRKKLRPHKGVSVTPVKFANKSKGMSCYDNK